MIIIIIIIIRINYGGGDFEAVDAHNALDRKMIKSICNKE